MRIPKAQNINILSKVLTGLSTAVNAAISATDTILIALGKFRGFLPQIYKYAR